MLLFRIRWRGATARHLKGRTLQRINKAAFHAVGLFWFTHFRPKHFRAHHAEEYGYAKRKGELLPRGSKRFKKSYTGRKLAMFGHTNPLVFSGKSQDRARAGRVIPTSKRVRVVMNAPALNFKPPKSRIVMRDELTRTTEAEQLKLRDVFGEERQKQVNRVNTETVESARAA